MITPKKILQELGKKFKDALISTIEPVSLLNGKENLCLSHKKLGEDRQSMSQVGEGNLSKFFSNLLDSDIGKEYY